MVSGYEGLVNTVPYGAGYSLATGSAIALLIVTGVGWGRFTGIAFLLTGLTAFGCLSAFASLERMPVSDS
jgi:hypothetical protein